MSKVAALRHQVERMTATIEERNAPRVIDCTGARDALLAKLQSQLPEGWVSAPLSEAEQEQIRAFKAVWSQHVADCQREQNVRYVSHEQR